MNSRPALNALRLVALVVAIGIKLVGLLVEALVIVPAAAAKNASGNLSSYAKMSGVIEIIGALSGVMLSYSTGLPAGPLVVVSGTVIIPGHLAPY